jgi:S-DNA-T family DNA segregation ATPase FtsK/SpoIIIE
MAKKSKNPAAGSLGANQLVLYTLWVLLAGAWIMVAAALVSYDPADAPGLAIAPHNAQPHNWIGRVGATLAHHILLMAGPGVWVLLAGWLFALVATVRRKPISQPVLRLIGVIIMAVMVSAIVGLSMPALTNRPEGSGGLLGIYIATELSLRFNMLGTFIILGLIFWVGAILAIDQVVIAIPVYLARMFHAMPKIAVPSPILVGRLSGLGRWIGGDDADAEEIDDAQAPPEVFDGPVDEDAVAVPAQKPIRRSGRLVVKEEVEEDAKPQAAEDDDEVSAEEDDGADDAPGAYVAEKAFDPEALRAKIKQMPINFAPKAAAKPAPAREVDLSGYRFPGIDLLVEPESSFTDEMEKLVRDQAILLEEALQQYHIEGEVVGIDSGPVITLYEVRLAAGTKVSSLSAVSSDLARALKAHNVRIVPNIVGKDTVGIEVPNLIKEKVRLKELMTAHQETIARMTLPMFLGKDASGNPLIEDLAKMPHMLIAGTTGSGKSVCMNSIIMSFLLTKRPDELKMVLVDPKMVEMSMFKDIPHLMCPVVTEMGKAAAILEWAVTKMDERYELLAEAGVRDIGSYNSLTWEEIKERLQPTNEEEEARIPKKLYSIVFIIDELADLMMTNKEVEGFIVRIAQKARAVGLHLILATQRPQANVVTGLIKSNMPCRVSFKVASGMDSRIVLDQKGAELLLGQGDMLVLTPRTSKLTRAQGTLVDDSEIRKSVKFLKEIAEQNFEPQLVQLRAPAAAGGDENMEKDPLLDDAVKVVLQTKRGSVSLLQRRLTIGYSRASRLIEQMAGMGLLGEYKGSQAREVTITLEEWEAMKAQFEADAAASAPSGGVADFEKNGGGDKDWANEGDEDESVPDEMDGEFRQ